MRKLKGLTLALACGLALVASGANFAQGNPQDDKGKKHESCCAMKEGKDGKQTRECKEGKECKECKEACCKDDSCCKGESCCCKGGECPMHSHDAKKDGHHG